jgi:hypothetical protein
VLLLHIELEFYFWSRLFENLSKVQTVRMCLPVGFWRVLKRRALEGYIYNKYRRSPP